jgi:chemotaxis response regulator CheB
VTAVPVEAIVIGASAGAVQALSTLLPALRRVDEDVAILIPHSPGCAAFPLPVLHGRVSLAKV